MSIGEFAGVGHQAIVVPLKAGSDLQLTDDQERGFEAIVNFIEGDQSTLVLSGTAGTGKTTLIQLIARHFHGIRSFCFTAPTNKATKVLMSMSAEQNSGVDNIITIHKLLGLKLTPDGAIKKLHKASDSSNMPYEVVVVDECSMVGSELREHINEVLDAFPFLKIIYMGDAMQLPPIGEEISETFTESEVEVRLTTIMRQAQGNPIIRLCQAIRESIIEGKTLYQLQSEKGVDGKSGVHVMPGKSFREWTRKAYSSKDYSENANSFKTVAWRNVTVDDANYMIRRAIYKADEKNRLPRFMVGERVVIAAPVTDMFGDAILASTDSEGIVFSCTEEETHPWVKAHGNFKVYHLVVDFFSLGPVDCYVLHEDSEKAFKKQLNQFSSEAKKDKSLWGSFWSFKDSFHDVRYAHAVTSHRAQGSTYKNVFVHHRDILLNRNKIESFKSLYVACSRASDNLMLLS